MKRRTAAGISLVLLSAGLTACGGGSSGGGAGENGPGEEGGDTDVVPSEDGSLPGPTPPTAPEGDIALYGVVALGDENGLASDALASFARLPSGVALAAFGNALSPSEEPCEVTPSGAADLMDLSVVFVPRPTGALSETIGAGETVLLSSETGGSYVELLAPSTGPFYEPSGGTLPRTEAVPDTVLVDVPGDVFPAFDTVAMPPMETLDGVAVEGADVDGADTLTRDARFTWRASEAGRDTRIRIETSTAGGFFLEDGVDVACLVPDTGAFSFPPAVREALGAQFSGESPTISRVAMRTRQQGEALLILVRESFAP